MYFGHIFPVQTFVQIYCSNKRERESEREKIDRGSQIMNGFSFKKFARLEFFAALKI